MRSMHVSFPITLMECKSFKRKIANAHFCFQLRHASPRIDPDRSVQSLPYDKIYLDMSRIHFAFLESWEVFLKDIKLCSPFD